MIQNSSLVHSCSLSVHYKHLFFQLLHKPQRSEIPPDLGHTRSGHCKYQFFLEYMCDQLYICVVKEKGFTYMTAWLDKYTAVILHSSCNPDIVCHGLTI